MSYGNLIEVNLDTSELDGRLNAIDDKLEGLSKREWDEDTIHDAIATYASNEGWITESDVDDKLRDVVSSDDLDSLIGDYLSNNDYMSSDGIEQKVSDAIENDSTIEDMKQRIEGFESDTPAGVQELEERVEKLEQNLHLVDSNWRDGDNSLAERLDALEHKLAERAEEFGDGLHHLEGKMAAFARAQEDFSQRVDSLTEQVKTQDTELTGLSVELTDLTQQVKAQDSAIDGQREMIEALTKRVVRAEERNDTAMTFFDLIKQAFALLQRGGS